MSESQSNSTNDRPHRAAVYKCQNQNCDYRGMDIWPTDMAISELTCSRCGGVGTLVLERELRPGQKTTEK